MTDLPFRPMSPTATVIVTNSSATTTLPGNPQYQPQLRIANLSGSATGFVEFGNNAIVSTATSSFPILAGASQIIQLSPNWTHMAAITLAGTTTLYITQGQGT